MKDVPAQFPDELGLAAILTREDPRDALVTNQYAHPEALPAGARVGTSSLRRQCQLSARYPTWQITSLRGNGLLPVVIQICQSKMPWRKA